MGDPNQLPFMDISAPPNIRDSRPLQITAEVVTAFTPSVKNPIRNSSQMHHAGGSMTLSPHSPPSVSSGICFHTNNFPPPASQPLLPQILANPSPQASLSTLLLDSTQATSGSGATINSETELDFYKKHYDGNEWAQNALNAQLRWANGENRQLKLSVQKLRSRITDLKTQVAQSELIMENYEKLKVDYSDIISHSYTLCGNQEIWEKVSDEMNFNLNAQADEIDKLKEELAKARIKEIEFQETIGKLEEKLKQRQLEAEKQSKTIAELQTTLKLKDQFVKSAIEDTYSGAVRKGEEKLAELRKSLEEEISSLKKNIGDKNDVVKSTEEKMQQLCTQKDTEILSLKNQIVESSLKLSVIAEQLKNKERKAVQMISTNQEQSRRISQLNQDLEQKEQGLKSYEGNILQQTLDLKLANKKVVEVEEERKRLSVEQDQLTHLISTQEDAIKQRQQSIVQIRDDMEKLGKEKDAEIANLKEKVNELKSGKCGRDTKKRWGQKKSELSNATSSESAAVGIESKSNRLPKSMKSQSKIQKASSTMTAAQVKASMGTRGLKNIRIPNITESLNVEQPRLLRASGKSLESWPMTTRNNQKVPYLSL